MRGFLARHHFEDVQDSVEINGEMMTPLHLAALRGNHSIVRHMWLDQTLIAAPPRLTAGLDANKTLGCHATQVFRNGLKSYF